jgi:hypothetical protein
VSPPMSWTFETRSWLTKHQAVHCCQNPKAAKQSRVGAHCRRMVMVIGINVSLCRIPPPPCSLPTVPLPRGRSRLAHMGCPTELLPLRTKWKWDILFMVTEFLVTDLHIPLLLVIQNSWKVG